MGRMSSVAVGALTTGVLLMVSVAAGMEPVGDGTSETAGASRWVLGKGQASNNITSHPGSRTTSYLLAGNQVDDAAGNREAARQTVNRWIRTSHRFDAVLDFDAVTRDPANARRLRPSVDEGDHLHLNPFGYKVLADAVPAQLFR